ncbi:MAG: MFS transporter [Anaerolineaceae bacterium]|nr:MFS transporter [Anaerolineaceae bacterium]
MESTEPIKNHGWRVTFAALGINLALGILYTWSVLSKRIPSEWGWDEGDKSLPYATACLVFSLIMVLAGRMQDRLGPRLVATIGGVLVGAGMIMTGMSTSLWGYIIGFGVLAGAGIGFGYASATPPAIKWFPPKRTGLIAGLVVSGFGLASVYAAPLSNWLVSTCGIQNTFIYLGIAFLVVVVLLAQLLVPPHRVMQFVKGLGPAGLLKQVDKNNTRKKEEFSPREMLGTLQFYLLWFMYACGAGAGLMIISKLAKIADQQAGIKLGFLLVAALAVGNGAGRVVAGVASDRLGRKATMIICFLLQAGLVFLLSRVTIGSFLARGSVLAIVSALIGANYGANLSLFPSITKDFFGLKNFGVNYGLVFTSWGVGGFMLALLAGKMYVKYQSFNVAYYGAAGLLIVAAIVTLLVKPPHHREPVEAGG